MTHKWLVVLTVISTLRIYARAVPDIHHARYKAAATTDAPGPSWSGHHDVLFPSQTNEEKVVDGDSGVGDTGGDNKLDGGDSNKRDITNKMVDDYDDGGGGGDNSNKVAGDRDADGDTTKMEEDSNKMVTGEDASTTDLNGNYRNSEDGPKDASGGKGESIVETLARHDAIRDMHQQADKMKMTAKEMEESGKEQANEAKAPSDKITSSTNATTATVPKDSAGNIIITNKTVEGDSKKANGEQVDPLKALRSATENLYQRAQHKNLPVDGPGDLTTPEQIYQALNRLEYIIDGFRHSQLESPNPDLNITEDVVGRGNTSGGGNVAMDDDDDDASTNNIDDGRFLQTRSRSKHKMDDDDDIDGDEDDDVDSIDGDDLDSTGDMIDDDDTNKMDDDGDGEDHSDGDSDGDDTNKMDTKKDKKMSSDEALAMLGNTVTELVGILDQVVAANTGVKNVLVHQKGDPIQVK